MTYTLYIGIMEWILFDGANVCGFYKLILLVLCDVLLWVTCLLHYNVRWFITLLLFVRIKSKNMNDDCSVLVLQ